MTVHHEGFNYSITSRLLALLISSSIWIKEGHNIVWQIIPQFLFEERDFLRHNMLDIVFPLIINFFKNTLPQFCGLRVYVMLVSRLSSGTDSTVQTSLLKQIEDFVFLFIFNLYTEYRAQGGVICIE